MALEPKSMKPLTPNQAATETRKRIKRAVKRLYNNLLGRDAMLPLEVDQFRDEIIKFIDEMDERQDKKPGGLGRGKKTSK